MMNPVLGYVGSLIEDINELVAFRSYLLVIFILCLCDIFLKQDRIGFSKLSVQNS